MLITVTVCSKRKRYTKRGARASSLAINLMFYTNTDISTRACQVADLPYPKNHFSPLFIYVIPVAENAPRITVGSQWSVLCSRYCWLIVIIVGLAENARLVCSTSSPRI